MTRLRKVWTQEDDEFLVKAVRGGKSRAAIAAEMGLTRNEVIGRVYRLERNLLKTERKIRVNPFQLPSVHTWSEENLTEKWADRKKRLAAAR